VDSKEMRELRKLIEFISASDLTEFEMEREGLRLKISRNAALPPAPTPTAAPPAAPVAAAESQETPEAVPAPAAVKDENLTEVLSPIVGTFYRAPRPDSSPFVEVGDRVRVGQILCIIEAMKVMNEIEAEVAGEIVEIAPSNAQPVEFEELLFQIRPSS
jgi:acetyl-CoA carboxylase biotin carboxyl carrier protein